MPWIDDPETGTSHYERPKKKLRAKTMAELFNEQQAARQYLLGIRIDWHDDPNHAQVEDTTFDGTPLREVGRQVIAENAEAMAILAPTDGPRVRVAGDGLGRLRKGEQYTKAES